MNAPAMLAALRERGVRVALEEGELKLRGSAQMLKPQVLVAARRLKPELRELLLLEAASQTEAQAAPVAPVAPEPQVLVAASICGAPSSSEAHAARLRLAYEIGGILAYEIGGILEALPGAKRLRSGDWRFEGEVWEHNQAVLLAAHWRGSTKESPASGIETRNHTRASYSAATIHGATSTASSTRPRLQPRPSCATSSRKYLLSLATPRPCRLLTAWKPSCAARSRRPCEAMPRPEKPCLIDSSAR